MTFLGRREPLAVTVDLAREFAVTDRRRVIMTDDIPMEPLCDCGPVSPRGLLHTTREDMRTLGRIVLTAATAIGGLMGLVTYWIG